MNTTGLVDCMRLFRVLPGPCYLVPFFYNLMSTSPGSHKHNLEKRVPGKNFRQAHTLTYSIPCACLGGFLHWDPMQKSG